MVNTAVTFGVIAIVVAFLFSLLAAFPLSSGALDMANPTGDGESTPQGIDGVEGVGDMLLFSYNDIITDIASFQDNPDLARAEARKNAFIGLAQNLGGQYKDFSQTLRGDMDELIAEADSESDS
ncbi:MAG: hypothetical protein PHV74_08120 [Dehalococcoidia bacterium]|nr:hypothetical protein [Dehalococcoidia bacterium]